MTQPEESARRPVERHFDEESAFWEDVYRQQTILGTIFRERQERALAWADREARASATALDVGCGAGMLSVELARRGFTVSAIDASEEMLRATRRATSESGVAESVSVEKGDVGSLAFPDGSFDLVAALGVLPWVDDPAAAVREMQRVLKPGGRLIFSCDNALALQLVVDPRLWPLWDPLKYTLRARLQSRWPRPERPRSFRNGTVVRLVEGAELELVEHTTIQFGPFSFFGVPLLSDARAWRLHSFLQRHADRRVPALRSLGRQHLVLARRPGGEAPRA